MEPRLSFEAVAELYERARPGHSAALIDQVVPARYLALLSLAHRDA